MTDEEIRTKYGYGAKIPTKKVVVGDIFLEVDGKTFYLVLNITRKQLTLLSMCSEYSNTNLIHMWLSRGNGVLDSEVLWVGNSIAALNRHLRFEEKGTKKALGER